MSDRPGRILWFVPEFRASTDFILASQELVPARLLADAGFEGMFVGSDTDESSARKALGMPVLQGLSRALVLTHFPRRPNYLTLRRSIRRVGRQSWPEIAAWRPDFVYYSNVAPASVARGIARRLGAQTVFYMKAAVCEESAYRHGRRGLGYRLLRRKEAATVRRADRLLCVSHPLRDWMRRYAGRADAQVIPCSVDGSWFHFRPEGRTRVRTLLGWPERAPVAAWCGGLFAWHRPRDTLRLLASLQARRPQLKVVLLTGEVDALQEMALAHGLSPGTFDVRRVPHGEMPDWLSAADIGLSLRESGPFTEVSSPIKIGEYLACGLPVVCNAGIGDHSELVQSAGVGTFADRVDERSIREADKLLSAAMADRTLRDRCRALARERLTWSAHLDTLRDVFSLD